MRNCWSQSSEKTFIWPCFLLLKHNHVKFRKRVTSWSSIPSPESKQEEQPISIQEPQSTCANFILFGLAGFKFTPLTTFAQTHRHTLTVMLYHDQTNLLFEEELMGWCCWNWKRSSCDFGTVWSPFYRWQNNTKRYCYFCKIKFIKYLLKTDKKVIMIEKIQYINNVIKIESQNCHISWLRIIVI